MNPYLIIGALLGSLLLGAAGGAWINGNAWEARYSGLVAEQSQAIAQAAIQGQQDQIELNLQIQEANDALELTKVENLRLNRCVADGTCVLHVKAKCPKLPSDSIATPGATEPAPELDAAARSDYISLRAGIAEQFSLLTKCYEFAESVQKGRHP